GGWARPDELAAQRHGRFLGSFPPRAGTTRGRWWGLRGPACPAYHGPARVPPGYPFGRRERRARVTDGSRHCSRRRQEEEEERGGTGTRFVTRTACAATSTRARRRLPTPTPTSELLLYYVVIIRTKLGQRGNYDFWRPSWVPITVIRSPVIVPLWTEM
ncbi:unnamed protein product, partial [Laminaria digitata]